MEHSINAVFFSSYTEKLFSFPIPFWIQSLKIRKVLQSFCISWKLLQFEETNILTPLDF